MKRRNHKNNYWKDVPEELKYMCLAGNSTEDSYCIQAALRYLKEHMNDNDSFLWETSPYEIIKWIDTVMEICLFPLELHEAEWETCKDKIEEILSREEMLIQKVGPADYKEGYITDYGNKRFDMIEFSQRLNVYLSVLFIYKEEWGKLQERLGMLLGDTERNVRNMLSYENAKRFVEEDDAPDYHYPGCDKWIPINWLAKECIPNNEGLRIFARVYDKYAAFIEEQSSAKHKKLLDQIRHETEVYLQGICDRILDEIEDILVEEDDLSETSIQQMKEEQLEFESMIENSSKRENGNDVKSDAAEEHNVLSGASKPYYQRWGRFSRKLCKLIREHPTLPIVYAKETDLDCDIGYVHDPKTGEFIEAIISVHGTKPIEDDELDVPF